MSESNISPLAKRLAEENNVDWRGLMGSGPEGRVVERDVLEYLARVMAGDEALDPTPEPLPEGMDAWPEEDVKGFQPASHASQAVRSGEGDLDLAGFQQGLAQSEAFDDRQFAAQDEDDNDLFELSTGTHGARPYDSPASGLGSRESDFDLGGSERHAFATGQDEQDEDEDDLLEIDHGFDDGGGAAEAPDLSAQAPGVSADAESGTEASISEDIFLFDDGENESDGPPVFAEAEPLAEPVDDEAALFDVGSEQASFGGTFSDDADEEAPDRHAAESPFSEVNAGEGAEAEDTGLVLDGEEDNADSVWGSSGATDLEADSDEIDLSEFEKELPGAAQVADEEETFMPVDLSFDEAEPFEEPSLGGFDGGGVEEEGDEEIDLEAGLTDVAASEDAASEAEPSPAETDRLAARDSDPVWEAPAAAARSQTQDEDALVEVETSGRDKALPGEVQLVSYGLLLRRHLDLTALSQAQVAVGRELADGSPVAPTAFLLRAAAKVLRATVPAEQGSVALAVISKRGLGARVVQDAAQKGFGALLQDIEAAQASQTTELERASLVVADMSEYEVDEAVLNAGAPVLTLGRVLYDSTEGRYRSTLSLSGEIPAEQGSALLAGVAELLDSPVQLVI